ncbi:hypothetical protein Avbf_06716 [Armadillidium vulgare]|nr:hypothetical protein Avbf_06716 [Armadillidium vulgare]
MLMLPSSLEIKPNLCRRCTLRFSLHPYSVYKKIYYSKPEEVLHFMERFYFKKALIKQIKAAISKVNPFSSTSKKKDEEEENQEETDKMIGENLASRRGMEEEDSEDEDDPAESQEQEADDGISGRGRGGKQMEQDYSEDDDEDDDDDVSNDEGEDESKTGEGEAKKKVTIKDEPLSDENELLGEGTDREPMQEIISADDTPMPPLLNYAVGKAVSKLITERKWKPSYLQDYDLKETVREGLNTSTTSADKPRKKVKNSSLPTNDYLIRKNRVLIEDNWIINYDFDEDSSLWCEITMVLPIAEGRYDLASIVKQTSATTMVHSVPGIKKGLRGGEGLWFSSQDRRGQYSGNMRL